MSFKSLLFKAVSQPRYTFNRAISRLEALIDDSRSQVFAPSTTEIINQKELRVLGLRRTGNHAIINWIEKQQTGVIHLNNLRVDENPYKYIYKAFSGHALPQDQWLAKETSRYPQYQGAEGLESLKKESQGIFKPKECLILSYEDFPIARVASPRFERTHNLYFGVSQQRFDVLILRDPYNLIASRLRASQSQGNMLTVKSISQTIADLWIEYAKEFVGDTQILNQTKVLVNYNQWVTDPDYRQALAQQLGIEFSDSGFTEVPKFGGGSSFDKTDFQGRATDMEVFRRWEAYAEDPEYRKLLRNEVLRDYVERIFGHFPNIDLLWK